MHTSEQLREVGALAPVIFLRDLCRNENLYRSGYHGTEKYIFVAINTKTRLL